MYLSTNDSSQIFATIYGSVILVLNCIIIEILYSVQRKNIRMQDVHFCLPGELSAVQKDAWVDLVHQ